MPTPEITAYFRTIGARGGRASSPRKVAACRMNAARPRPGARGKRSAPAAETVAPAAVVPVPAQDMGPLVG